WRPRALGFSQRGRREREGAGCALLRCAASALRAAAAKSSYGWEQGGDGTGLDELEGGLDGAEAELGGGGRVGDEGLERGAGDGGQVGIGFGLVAAEGGIGCLEVLAVAEPAVEGGAVDAGRGCGGEDGASGGELGEGRALALGEPRGKREEQSRIRQWCRRV